MFRARDRRCRLDCEEVLARLSRTALVRSWEPAGDRYTVVVGRGSIAPSTLDWKEVQHLAAVLERDRVRLAGAGFPMGHATTRFRLSDGRLLDHNRSRIDRHPDHPYTVLAPGGHPSGCAGTSLQARTRAEALALAALARVRGRCADCGHHRPLVHHERWQPDPRIPCPSCGAAATAGIVLLCRGCGEPIQPALAREPFGNAWLHTGTGREQCTAREHRAHCDPRPTLARLV